jgi:hypothetical protein
MLPHFSSCDWNQNSTYEQHCRLTSNKWPRSQITTDEAQPSLKDVRQAWFGLVYQRGWSSKLPSVRRSMLSIIQARSSQSRRTDGRGWQRMQWSVGDAVVHHLISSDLPTVRLSSLGICHSLTVGFCDELRKYTWQHGSCETTYGLRRRHITQTDGISQCIKFVTQFESKVKLHWRVLPKTKSRRKSR